MTSSLRIFSFQIWKINQSMLLIKISNFGTPIICSNKKPSVRLVKSMNANIWKRLTEGPIMRMRKLVNYSRKSWIEIGTCKILSILSRSTWPIRLNTLSDSLIPKIPPEPHQVFRSLMLATVCQHMLNGRRSMRDWKNSTKKEKMP